MDFFYFHATNNTKIIQQKWLLCSAINDNPNPTIVVGEALDIIGASNKFDLKQERGGDLRVRSSNLSFVAVLIIEFSANLYFFFV